LVADAVHLSRNELAVVDHRFDVSALRRIVVLGGGKAGAGMAAAVECVLGDELVDHKVSGWVNVPADCVRPLRKIHLHASRPAGINEPTEAGVIGARQILSLARQSTADDLCLVLLSGGGSALLPAPKPPLTLADKLAVTRFLTDSGATIEELNTVRKRLSLIKGGGLARASGAGHLIALIISDIVGDPLDLIASGPTCADSTTNADALGVLRKFHAQPPDVPETVLSFLARDARKTEPDTPLDRSVANYIVGNNALALRAAARRAGQLGYVVQSLGSDNRGEANEQGRNLAERCVAIRDAAEFRQRPVCLLSGGEPVVRLSKTVKPGRGGRNQQLVLAALMALHADGMDHIAILAGGTDGEDGPTDAAGAWADAAILRRASEQGLNPQPYLDRNDAYTFFQQLGGLFKTGPTHTNVMDLRVALVA
jgi:hydroxypyruvate reductase